MKFEQSPESLASIQLGSHFRWLAWTASGARHRPAQKVSIQPNAASTFGVQAKSGAVLYHSESICALAADPHFSQESQM